MKKLNLFMQSYSVTRISVSFVKTGGKISGAVGDVWLSKEEEGKAMHLGMYRRNAGYDNPIVFCNTFDNKVKKGVKLYCHSGTKALMDLINKQIHKKADLLRRQKNAAKAEKKEEQVVVAARKEQEVK